MKITADLTTELIIGETTEGTTGQETREVQITEGPSKKGAANQGNFPE